MLLWGYRPVFKCRPLGHLLQDVVDLARWLWGPLELKRQAAGSRAGIMRLMLLRSICSRGLPPFSPWLIWDSVQIHLEAFSNAASIPPTVCSANVDISTGNLFWLPCDRGTIQKTRVPGADSYTLYSTRNIILQLLLDWPRRVLYWVESGKPLQSMTLDGKTRQEVWRGTWAADTRMALDLGSASILWTTKGLGKYYTTVQWVESEAICPSFFLV